MKIYSLACLFLVSLSSVQAQELPVYLDAIITNIGKIAGEEVVQLYLTDRESSVRVPLYSLVGFKRLHLAPGVSEKVSFTITPDIMSVYNETGEKLLERGSFRVDVGGSSPGSRSEQLGMSKPAAGVFVLR
jgi:beta-glucosidase